MKILVKNSLAKTIDNIGEVLFFGRKIPASERKAVAEWRSNPTAIRF
ncbi:hypothetical protein J7K50_00070 [bacterium]|nr:hypothetical protein [bacterium]